MATFSLTSGVDNFGGSPIDNNTFEFTPSTLQSTDTIVGNPFTGFIDILSLTSPGTLTVLQFSGVLNMERLVLPDGTNHVTLNSFLVSGSDLPSGFFEVFGGNGDDTVDNSPVVIGKRLLIVGAAGADILTGGNEDDVIHGGP